MSNSSHTLHEHFRAARIGPKPHLISSRDVEELLDGSTSFPIASKGRRAPTGSGSRIALIALAILTGTLASLSLMGGAERNDEWNDISEDPRYQVFILRDSSTGDSTVFILPVPDPRETVAMAEMPESGPVTIPEERLLELRPDELARFGTRVDTSGVWVYFKGEHGKVQENGFVRDGVSISPEADREKWKMLGPLEISPRLITDDRGHIRETMLDENKVDSGLAAKLRSLPVNSREHIRLLNEMSRKSDVYMMQRISSLVPILVRSGWKYTRDDSVRNRWHPDIVMWYEPTPEFLALLPERMRTKLVAALVSSEAKPEVADEHRSSMRAQKTESARRERVLPVPAATEGSTDDILRATGRVEDVHADDPVTGDLLYPVARRSSGTILDLLVAPNPAYEKTIVRCRLAEARNLRIVLHDIFGREIRELASIQPTASECAVEVSLKGVRSGIYLLSVSSDRGEQVVQRIVVE